MLGGVTALVGRLYGGVAMAYGNSSSVPFDRQFYCGGSNGMRGWTPRTLGQGSVANPHNDYPVQTGDVKLEANLELRFPVWGIIHGATFFDLGNIWYIRENPKEYSDDAVFRFNRFYKQLGFNTGRPALRHQIRRAASRLGHPAPQSQQSRRRAVDSQFPLEEYGAEFRRRLPVLIYPFPFIRSVWSERVRPEIASVSGRTVS